MLTVSQFSALPFLYFWNARYKLRAAFIRLLGASNLLGYHNRMALIQFSLLSGFHATYPIFLFMFSLVYGSFWCEPMKEEGSNLHPSSVGSASGLGWTWRSMMNSAACGAASVALVVFNSLSSVDFLRTWLISISGLLMAVQMATEAGVSRSPLLPDRLGVAHWPCWSTGGAVRSAERLLLPFSLSCVCVLFLRAPTWNGVKTQENTRQTAASASPRRLGGVCGVG